MFRVLCVAEWTTLLWQSAFSQPYTAIWEQFEKWMAGVLRVLYNDLRNACDGSVIERCEARDWEANKLGGRFYCVW